MCYELGNGTMDISFSNTLPFTTQLIYW